MVGDTLSEMGIGLVSQRVPATIEWHGKDSFTLTVTENLVKRWLIDRSTGGDDDIDDDGITSSSSSSSNSGSKGTALERAAKIISSDREGHDDDVDEEAGGSATTSTPTRRSSSQGGGKRKKNWKIPSLSNRQQSRTTTDDDDESTNTTNTNDDVDQAERRRRIVEKFQEIKALAQSVFSDRKDDPDARRALWGTVADDGVLGLSGAVQYTRIPVHLDTWTDVFTGVYLGNFGPYGPEILRVARHMIEGEEWVMGTKLTGDVNVPAGKVSFRAKAGREHRLSPAGVYPPEYGVMQRYKGQGRVAREGYSAAKWVDGELLTFAASNPIARGAELGFVFNIDASRKYLLLFTKVKLDEIAPSLSTSMEP